MSKSHIKAPRLPPLHGLRGFEASVRTGSFTAAAQELGVTQGAVSRQVQQLEEQLGLRLFSRSRAGLRLTPDGAAWLADLRPILRRLELATERARARSAGGGVLTLSVPASFGAFWLLPRLARFQATDPRITVNLVTRIGAVDPDDRPIDAAIVYAEEAQRGFDDLVIAPLTLMAVAAPATLPDRAEETLLERLPLLGQTSLPGAWRQYFDAAGLDPNRMVSGPAYDLMTMGAMSAEAGLGAALLPDFVCGPAIAAGRLRRIGGRSLPTQGCYRLRTPTGMGPAGVLGRLRAWLAAEARAGGD